MIVFHLNDSTSQSQTSKLNVPIEFRNIISGLLDAIFETVERLYYYSQTIFRMGRLVIDLTTNRVFCCHSFLIKTLRVSVFRLSWILFNFNLVSTSVNQVPKTRTDRAIGSKSRTLPIVFNTYVNLRNYLTVSDRSTMPSRKISVLFCSAISQVQKTITGPRLLLQVNVCHSNKSSLSIKIVFL